MELLHLELLKKEKNLLAFSGGVDSTALFFLLQEKGVKVDLAIVDYSVRKESKLEVEYAKELAKRYDLNLFLLKTKLSSSNFEAKAREIRYNFFKKIITQYSYTTLITAHQLNDRLEWFFMQLSKGAGLVELLGMESIVKKEGYTLVRPLLNISKKELLNYLNKNNIPYFIDKTNFDTTFFRNYIRHHFSDKFLELYSKGVKRSFKYLSQDKKELLDSISIFNIQELYGARIKKGSNLFRIFDLLFKKHSYLLSTSQKKEILHQKSGVIANKIAFGFWRGCFLTAPYIKIKLLKEQKELFRKEKFPIPLRFYVAKKGIFFQLKQNCTTLERNVQ